MSTKFKDGNTLSFRMIIGSGLESNYEFDKSSLWLSQQEMLLCISLSLAATQAKSEEYICKIQFMQSDLILHMAQIPEGYFLNVHHKIWVEIISSLFQSDFILTRQAQWKGHFFINPDSLLHICNNLDTCKIHSINTVTISQFVLLHHHK